MDEYKVAVYISIADAYYVVKHTDNYYDGVIETIAIAKAKRCKAALVQDSRIVYTYDSRQ